MTIAPITSFSFSIGMHRRLRAHEGYHQRIALDIRPLPREIGNMLHRLGSSEAGEWEMRKLALSYQRLMSSIRDICWRRSVHRGHAEAVSLSKMEYAELGLAEAGHLGAERPR